MSRKRSRTRTEDSIDSNAETLKRERADSFQNDLAPKTNDVFGGFEVERVLVDKALNPNNKRRVDGQIVAWTTDDDKVLEHFVPSAETRKLVKQRKGIETATHLMRLWKCGEKKGDGRWTQNWEPVHVVSEGASTMYLANGRQSSIYFVARGIIEWGSNLFLPKRNSENKYYSSHPIFLIVCFTA